MEYLLQWKEKQQPQQQQSLDITSSQTWESELLVSHLLPFLFHVDEVDSNSEEEFRVEDILAKRIHKLVLFLLIYTFLSMKRI